MKTKLLLYSIIGAILTIIAIDLFSVGNKHVEVVEENTVLVESNEHLKSENGTLKSANAQLKAEKDSVVTKLGTVTKKLNVILKANSESLPPVIIKIEDDINLDMGWTNPQDAFERLQEKLSRVPTKEELKKTFTTLVEKDLLFFSSEKDPYIKSTQVIMSDIDMLVNTCLQK